LEEENQELKKRFEEQDQSIRKELISLKAENQQLQSENKELRKEFILLKDENTKVRFNQFKV